MSIWIIYLFAYDWDDPFHYNAKFYFPTEKEDAASDNQTQAKR